jgi:hypothetical protein
MHRLLRSWSFGSLLLIFSLPMAMGHEGGCGGEEEDDDDGDHDGLERGPPSGAVCPEGSALTSDNFGRSFMESYCLRCHSESVTGAARMGAPSDHNFDTMIEVRGLAEHIDEMAGAGPESTNEIMPTTAPKPTLTEREQLAEWLACGAP